YNEEGYLGEVLEQAQIYPVDILVVDDGSADRTPEVLKRFPSIRVIRHETNKGYGATLRDAFDYGIKHGYDVVITMDSDKQHEPSLIPLFLEEATSADIVSGSRYL